MTNASPDYNTWVNVRLYERMQEELDEFRTSLLDLDPMEIMEKAYELTIKEDIVLALENENLSSKDANTLMKSEHPLQDCYEKYERSYSHHMDEIISAVECRAHEVQREQWKRDHIRDSDYER